MHQGKGKRILTYLLLLVTVGSINNIELKKIKFDKVEKVYVSGLSDRENKNLKNEIKNLNLENIFFISSVEILKIIDSNPLIEKYMINKIYPSTIDIKIKKTTFLAKINYENGTFLLGSNGKLSKTMYSNKELPFIFGKPKIYDFLTFKDILDHSKFSYNKIKNFYFYPSKRWDIEIENNIIIKLPKTNVMSSLNQVYAFLNDNNLKNIKIIDARVKNQIILND